MTDRLHKKNGTSSIILLCAAAGGLILSFVGFGVLWAGTPWHYQLLMFFPFLLLSFAVRKVTDANDNAFLPIIFGAAPVGVLITMFRDKNDSHLMSILIICSWIAGILLGYYLASILKSEKEKSGL